MSPHGRTLSDFGPLQAAERLLLEGCRTGLVAAISDKRPDSPTVENSIRAQFLRFLLLGGDIQAPVHELGVQARGVYVCGVLDLRRAFVPHALDLQNCSFDLSPVLSEAQLKQGAALRGCSMPGLLGNNLVAGGAIHLCNGFHSKGIINLGGARIAGELNCAGADFQGDGQDALLANGIKVEGSVVLGKGFKATGTIHLRGAQVEGQLLCTAASLDGGQGRALSADTAVVKNAIFLNGGFKAVGAVQLAGAQIGPLFCTAGSFHSEQGDALSFENAVVDGSVRLDSEFRAIGTVRLMGARIGGALVCRSASFDGHGGAAIAADGVAVRGAVFFDEGFRAAGLVHLVGAHVDGLLSCSGGSFDAKDDVALTVEGAVIKNSAVFRGFKAVGTVVLSRTRVDGVLNFAGASLDGKGANALDAVGAVFKSSVLFHKGCTTVGTVRLSGARVDGSLDFAGASLDGNGAEALMADDVRVADTLNLRNLERPLRGVVLSAAHVHKLVDDANTWAGELHLDGFVYDFLMPFGPMHAAQRLKWLDMQHSTQAGLDNRHGASTTFRPQPWRQLQRYFESIGHLEEVREIGIAFEHRLRKVGLVGQGLSGWPGWLQLLYSTLAHSTHCGYFWLTGYGYRPMRLLAWFLGSWIACGALYWYAAAHRGVFAPSDPLVFQNEAYLVCRPDRETGWLARQVGLQQGDASSLVPSDFRGAGNWYLCSALPAEYAGFSPLAYSLDVFLPFVDLQQESAWAPMIPTPKSDYFEELMHFSFHHFVRLVLWFETLVGWLVSLLTVAIVSGLTRRREEA